MLKLHHWLVCLLLMNVPLYGMFGSFWFRGEFDGSSVERRITGYEDYKKEIENRINQGLKGSDLIKAYKEESCDILTRCVCEACPDLLQRLIDYDPSIKNSDEFHGALSTSAWKQNLELTKWFIVNGAHVDFNGGDALREAAKKNLRSVVILLLMHSANPNLQNSYGSTTLHEVVMFGSSRTLSNFSTKQDKCDMVRLLIIGGTDISLRMYNNCGSGSKNNEKTAIEIAQRKNRKNPGLAELIEQTALQRDSLFAAVTRGENILFRSTKDEELESWISRRHGRDIHGNSLLYYAFAYNNLPVAQKLIYLWPQLLAQPNFKGETVLYLFPQRCIELLQFNSIL